MGPWTRRDCLGAFGATAATAFAGSAANAGATRIRSDADRLVRMRSSPDGQPVMWVYQGVLLLKLEGQVARPVTGVSGMSFTRAVEREPGVHDWQLDEVGYYTDLSTGAVLDTFVNPYTGSTVLPANYRSPQKLTYTGSLALSREPLPPGATYEGRITRLADVAGLAAMTEDLYVSIPAIPAANGRPTRAARMLSSLGSFSAAAADLDGTRAKWIDCQMSYSTMNSFAPWLQMDGTAGVQNIRLAGRKCRLFERDTIPPWLRARVERDHPQFFAEPLTWK
jgi:hypothetical protein